MTLETIHNRKTAGIALQCYRCQYKWTYKGNLIFASCPSCRHPVKAEKRNLAPSCDTKDQIPSSTTVVEGGP